MITIIAGCREGVHYKDVAVAASRASWKISEVVSGGARGADALGEQWAMDAFVKLSVMNAQWDLYGKRAGMIRNVEMAIYAEALIALWDEESRGTGHMVEEAKRQGLKVAVYNVIFGTIEEY